MGAGLRIYIDVEMDNASRISSMLFALSDGSSDEEEIKHKVITGWKRWRKSDESAKLEIPTWRGLFYL